MYICLRCITLKKHMIIHSYGNSRYELILTIRILLILLTLIIVTAIVVVTVAVTVILLTHPKGRAPAAGRAAGARRGADLEPNRPAWRSSREESVRL